MLVRSIRPESAAPLVMDGVSGVRMEVLVGRADGAPTFSMRHFVVEPGGHTPHHAHNYEHEVVILEGEAEVQHGAEVHRVSAGSALLIEANQMHQFRNTGRDPLRFLCFVPVTFDCGKPVPGS